ncbi:MAG TPA: GNAT family N-acetyltransferase [Flavobacterium sp.]|jgi:hypothetical protein
MQENIPKGILEKWLTGWSLSRELPLPKKYKSGFKTDVGYEKQKIRYVFSNLNNDFIELANSIIEPWVFLKVCVGPDALQDILPPRWVIQPQGYMMTYSPQITEQGVNLDKDYKIEFEQYNSTYSVKIYVNNKEVAATGRVVLVDDLAIYDRISTTIGHRRKGLATIIIKELEKVAASKGINKYFLVATEEGKLLYESLGWEQYCLYTSVVIPES